MASAVTRAPLAEPFSMSPRGDIARAQFVEPPVMQPRGDIARAQFVEPPFMCPRGVGVKNKGGIQFRPLNIGLNG